MQEIVPGIFVETTYPPYNLALISLDEGALLVNAPPRPSHAEAWLIQAQEHAHPLRYLVLTDAAPERLIGAAACDMPIIAGETTLRILARKTDREWHELTQAMAHRYPDEAAAINNLKQPQVTLACDEALTLYHRTPPLRFVELPGTTPGAIAIKVEEHQVLFTGDVVTIDAPLPLEYAVDSKAWLNLLGDLAFDTDIQRIAPGRGQAVILRGEIEQVREFLRVMRRISRTLERSAEEIGYKKHAQDLGQAFYNRGGQQAVKWIQRGLKRLVEEIILSQAREEAESEESPD